MQPNNTPDINPADTPIDTSHNEPSELTNTQNNTPPNSDDQLNPPPMVRPDRIKHKPSYLSD
ncbi:hypothetical protein A2U01_0087861, partial [Trifolium medium]|nr:hypothetical protein [Trifolium medium]